MAQFRPAGLSDEDDESDDYGFYEKPTRYHYHNPQPNLKKKTENNLQDAIINGNMREVEKIVICELHNNVNEKLESGWTPLMHACFHAQDKIVQFLLEKGADPNLHADAVTPIMAVCSNSSASNDAIFSIIVNLLSKGCIVNIGDRYGQTPLMRAIASGRVAVVEKLLEHGTNIEMRDQSGWTAVFWCCHHNKPEILEALIAKGARLAEVDKTGRTPLHIAELHEYEHIMEILNRELKTDEAEDEKYTYLRDQVRSWHEYYPGINKGEKPNYSAEVTQLLYGMNCERLTSLILNSGIDLRTFLLLEEDDMIQLGIEMPYERQRLKQGLRKFHLKGWNLNAVSGLYARKAENYCVLDCLTSLGNHLQQLYVLEATLHYTLREYNRVESQIKFEPPDSPVVAKLKTTAKKMLTHINSIRSEIINMKNALTKISRSNPQPADLIREKSLHSSYLTQALVVGCLGLVIYHGKRIFSDLLKK